MIIDRAETPLPDRRPALWATLATGLAGGAYLGRLVAECTAQPWRAWPLAGLVLAALALGLALSVWAGRRGLCRWPLGLLAVYVAWPWPWTALGLAVGVGVALLLVRLNWRRAVAAPWPEAAILAATLALYVSTLAPGVLPADSGEFQLAGAVLGIAHPPGYALYTMLGRLFTLIPLNNAAWRVNLFGAACGALTLAVVARAVRGATGSNLAALAAAAMLGLSTTFWAQSTTANIRSLTALFTALIIMTALRWGARPTRGRLAACAAVFGLGVGHHASLGFLALPLGLYILAVQPRLLWRPSQWWPALLALAASLLPLAYLPIRSQMGAPFDADPIRSWADFWAHISAAGFRDDMLHYRTWAELAPRLRVWLAILALQFGPILPVAALLSPLAMGQRNWRAIALLLGVWAVNSAAALTYRAPQTVEYLLPSYVALAVLLGCGLGMWLGFQPRRALPNLLAAALLLLAGWNGIQNYASYQALSRDTSAGDEATAILQDAPENALILAGWHQATVYWYLQQVEGLRPDVEVQYVYPEGATPNEQVWLGRVAEAIAARPVIVTNRYHAYEGSPYTWVPFHTAWLARLAPLDEAPAGISARGASFVDPAEEAADGIRLLGYQLDAADLAPGEDLSLRVYWQPEGALSRDYTAFVQLVGPEGVVGQGDLAQPTRTYGAGEVRVDAYRFPLLLHAQPGEYQLIAGFYYAVEGGWQRLQVGGADYVTLQTVTVQAAETPPATLHPAYDVYAGGWALVGTDYDRGVPGQTRVYLHWRRVSGNAAEARVTLVAGGQTVWQGVLPVLAAGQAATLAADLPDGVGTVRLDLAAANGTALPRLGPWHRPTAGCELTLPTEAVRYVPLGGEMAFLGWEESPTAAVPGGTVSLTAQFLALRPLTHDYSISVGVAGCEADWEVRSDGTPALGLIPTLKWVSGWRIRDARGVSIPAEAPAGTAQSSLAVYDAFTLEALNVLDERLVRQGQGTQLTPGTLAIR